MADKVLEYKQKYNLGFALYGTPSESLCDRFARVDKQEFGDIKGITDKGYYDNSFHVSSRINMSPFEKLPSLSPVTVRSTSSAVPKIPSLPDSKIFAV